MNDRTNLSTQHLSEADLECCLIGDAAPEAAAHLSACRPCRAALVEMESPLVSFRAVSLAWSERHSATLPLNDLAAARRREATGWRQRVTAAACMAAALAVGVALPMLHRGGNTQTVQSASTPTVAQASPTAAVAQTAVTETASATFPAALEDSHAQQIQRDNQMLRDIDQELNFRSESPAALGLSPATSGNPSVPSQMQD